MTDKPEEKSVIVKMPGVREADHNDAVTQAALAFMHEAVTSHVAEFNEAPKNIVMITMNDEGETCVKWQFTSASNPRMFLACANLALQRAIL